MTRFWPVALPASERQCGTTLNTVKCGCCFPRHGAEVRQLNCHSHYCHCYGHHRFDVPSGHGGSQHGYLVCAWGGEGPLPRPPSQADCPGRWLGPHQVDPCPHLFPTAFASYEHHYDKIKVAVCMAVGHPKTWPDTWQLLQCCANVIGRRCIHTFRFQNVFVNFQPLAYTVHPEYTCSTATAPPKRTVTYG